MINMTGFTPVYGEQVNGSELCATCHTLFTPYVDDDGNIAGMFAEQTPYLEWLNSDYPGEEKPCQSCHMPLAENPVDIATVPAWHTEERTPFWKHWFTGSNAFMYGLLSENGEELGLTSTSEQYDSSEARTLQNLMNHTLDLDVSWEVAEDSVYLDVHLVNLAGHKLPTGIPLRRLWVHVTGYSDSEEILFESGGWDEDGEISGLDDGYEPHHDMINGEDQVAVYEGVLGDVNGDVTYTLLRAAEFLKDNRIPPQGYTQAGPFADTTAVYGAALNDSDFNLADGEEGTGADIVHYRIPLISRFRVEVCFQIVKPAIAEHLGEIPSDEASLFTFIYSDYGNEPVVISVIEDVITSGGRDEPAELPGTIAIQSAWPNPFNSSVAVKYYVDRTGFFNAEVYDIQGRLVKVLVREVVSQGFHTLNWNGTGFSSKPQASGIYLLRLSSGQKTTIRKIVLLR